MDNVNKQGNIWYFDTNVLYKESEDYLEEILKIANNNDIEIYISEIVFWELVYDLNKIKNNLIKDMVIYKSWFQDNNVNIIPIDQNIYNAGKNLIDNKNLYFSNKQSGNDKRDAYIFATALEILPKHSIIYTNEKELRKVFIENEFLNIKNKVILEDAYYQSNLIPKHRITDITKKDIEGVFTFFAHEILKLHDPDQYDYYLCLKNPQKILQKRILGYISWFDPFENNQLFDVLKENGHLENEISLHIQLLMHKKLIIKTDNYLLPNFNTKANIQIFIEAMNLIKHEIIDVKMLSSITQAFKKFQYHIKLKKFIEQQAKFIKNNLQQHTSYNDLNTQLEFLNIICYRVPEKTINILKAFLERLKTLRLTADFDIHYDQYMSVCYTAEKLIIESLEIIINLRYIQTFDVMNILFEYVHHKNEDIAKKAKEGMERLVKYNITVFDKISIKPQQDFFKKINHFDKNKRKKYFDILVTACGHILLSEMDDTEFYHGTFTFSKADIPTADKPIQKLRLDTFNYLKKLYKLAINTSEKKQVKSAIGTLSSSPQSDDIISVLEWYKEVIQSETDMQVLQSIENRTYWINRLHDKQNDDILRLALEIRNMLYTHSEYKIFRVLIGFDAVFYDWEAPDKDDLDEANRFRNEQMRKLAESLNENNIQEWKERIFDYCSIDSNDMATFPYFCQFLCLVSELYPCFALDLLENHAKKIESFIAAFLIGLCDSDKKNEMIILIKKWSEQGEYLPQILRFLQLTSEFHTDIINIILREAIDKSDTNALLSQIIIVVTTHYKDTQQSHIDNFFMPALEALSKQSKESWGWINDFYFQDNLRKILDDMNNTHYKKILDNLVLYPRVDYHLETVLLPIAEKSSEMIIDFFINRFKYKKQNEKEFLERGYEALPFGGFQKLSKSLAVNPSMVLQKVFMTYDNTRSWEFEYYGGQLIHHIFPDFTDNLETELIKYIHKDALYYWDPIIYFLKNYTGNLYIHNISKELIKVADDAQINELKHIFTARISGHGEYGIAEFYERKAQEIEPWLDDPNSKIKDFAKEFIKDLGEQAKQERNRADETIILRKHEYGMNINNE